MSEDTSIRITSVFTLANSGEKSKEVQNEKTEEKNSLSCQNEQWPLVCSLEGERSSKNLYISSKELIKLAQKHEEENVNRSSVTVNNAKSLSSNSAVRQLDNKAVSNSSDTTVDQGNIYTVFKVVSDACPSFCCQYNPALIATLRAKTKVLNKQK